MNLFHQLHPHLSLSQPQHIDRPEDYLLSEELIGAVNVAMASGQPLLITGEPGTGKTQLAYKLAIELHQQDNQFLREPLVFHTKTSSVASELFYTYDALGHFQKANIKQAGTSTSSVDHIQLQALG
ncbi:MAG: sigma 54-interacting transcriptional regulator, partial [Bacteroidota bacterium]